MSKHCEQLARKGTGEGTCDAVLDGDVCPRSRQHIEYDVNGRSMTRDEWYDWLEAGERRVWGNE